MHQSVLQSSHKSALLQYTGLTTIFEMSNIAASACMGAPRWREMGQILTDYSRIYRLLPSDLGYGQTQETGFPSKGNI